MKDLGIPDFPSQIESLVESANLTYMDAVLHWCELRGLEYEVGGDLVKRHSSIKSKVRDEALVLNFVK
jgi:hypothetical protein